MQRIFFCNSFIDSQFFLLVLERIGVANREVGVLRVQPMHLSHGLVFFLRKRLLLFFIVSAGGSHGVVGIRQQLVSGLLISETCRQSRFHLLNPLLHAVFRAAHAVNAVIRNETFGSQVVS